MPKIVIFPWLAGLMTILPLHMAVAGQITSDAAEARRYRACIEQTRGDPETAVEEALSWRDMGGGFPARHCLALAEAALKAYEPAALRLESLARDMQAGNDATMAASVLDQAGNMWVLAGNPRRAEAALARARQLQPRNIRILLDHARMLAALQRYDAAATTLDTVLQLDPSRADALAFRAAARRHLGRLSLAMEDAELALALRPGMAEALLERGYLHRLAGRKGAARRDWLALLNRNPYGPAADAARAALAAMDVKTETQSGK